MAFTFEKERCCPLCGAKFTEADEKPEYDPVIVVVCPSCGKLLWRPGLEADSDLHPYDPNADAGGI